MIKEITIKNYKSIFSASLDLGKLNIFIGPNGSGKTNLLEAIATFSAEKEGGICIEDLIGKGVRVAKPELTIGSFYGKQGHKVIEGSIRGDVNGKLFSKIYKLICEDWENVYSDWINDYRNHPLMNMEHFIRNSAVLGGALRHFHPDLLAEKMEDYSKSLGKFKTLRRTFENKERADIPHYTEVARKHLANFLIYSPSLSALRGFTNESKKVPLGLHGEGLDLLISSFNNEEQNLLYEFACHYIGWLQRIILEENDQFKTDGYKLSRSNSTLFFMDRLMQKKNRLLSVENVDDGTLRILFYLALIISSKTPSFFALDNIDTGLNPLLLSPFINELIDLVKQTQKQILITTNSPILLDILDIENTDICLFSVKRTEEGQTEIKKISFSRKELKIDPLSNKWIRGDL